MPLGEAKPIASIAWRRHLQQNDAGFVGALLMYALQVARNMHVDLALETPQYLDTFHFYDQDENRMVRPWVDRSVSDRNSFIMDAVGLDFVAGIVPQLIIGIARLREFDHNQDALGGGLTRYALRVVRDIC